MEAAGKHKFSPAAKAVSLAVILVAIALAGLEISRSGRLPSTDDATIDADVVYVAPAVGGRIIRIAVEENATVKRGQVLFELDPIPYRLAVDQARADLLMARAALETQGRAVATQRSTSLAAGDQIQRASDGLALARRTVVRLRPLAEKGYVPQQQLDQAETAARDAQTSLEQSREQHRGATVSIDTTDVTLATVKAREAALAIAERALSDTVVRASQSGRVVGLTVMAGEMVVPSQALFTLVSSDQWFAVGDFRETQLGTMSVGDCATVYSMIDRSKPLEGKIDGIGSGVLDTDRVNLPKSLPYVERSLNWVRVAQRFPVRVRLAGPPANLMRLGASAVIEIRHGVACGR